MKRYMIVGIAVTAILGMAIAMAAASTPALADNAYDGMAQVGTVIDEGGDAATAVTQDPIATPVGQYFIDEDGDGICDTCGNVPGTGIGNHYGQGAVGGNFVDLDGDGICDNCTPLAPADGTGNQFGRGNGRNGAAGSNFVDEDGDGICDTCGNVPGTGAGGNFVDQDGDGICDNCGTAPVDGTGSQYGRQGGQGQRGGRWNN